MIQALLNLLRRLFGRTGGEAGEPNEHPCTTPHHLEIPSEIPYDNIPVLTSTEQVARFDLFSAPSHTVVVPPLRDGSPVANCRVTIRPELGNVNIRLGPGLGYEPPITRAQGGVTFRILGASEADDNDLRWYAVQLGSRSGWIRSDLVQVSQECLGYSFISPEDLIPAQPPLPMPENRFPLPLNTRITYGFFAGRHPGFDMAANTGTPLYSPTTGVCIRRLICTRCTEARPNRQPNHLLQCPDTWNDPGWGYGFGTFIIMRFDYIRLPRPLREEMDRLNLKGGFAYILYAHLSRVDVQLGQQTRAGIPLGLTGNTGCSTGPHLHFEVRVGRDSEVDNTWAQQRAVHPRLMFEV
jgi:hypothetical protein